MYNFILQTVVFVSLGIVIYLLARVSDRVGDIEPSQKVGSFTSRFMRRLPLEKLDAMLHIFFEKFLRKMKVVVMKADNFLNTHIGKLRKTNSSNGASHQKLPDALDNGKKE